MSRASSASGFHSTPHSLPPSLPSGVHSDDTASTYSYRSTVSTNYTTSNLPGPGRLLGNFYSWLGSLFEKRFGEFSDLATLWTNVEAEAMLKNYWTIYYMLRSGNTRELECVCRILLICAGSTDVLTQIRAFWTIIDFSIERPSKILTAFANIFQEGKDTSDIVMSSWRRPDMEYNIWWEYYYKLAFRCLSVDPSSVIGAARRTYFASREQKFSDFERILLSCSRDTTDSLLAIRFFSRYWTGRGLESYAQERGFSDSAIVHFAMGLITHWEVHFTMCARETRHLSSLSCSWTTAYFLRGLWGSLRKYSPEGLDEIFEDDSRLVVWAHIYTLHFILRSFRRECRHHWLEYRFQSIAGTWKELCHEFLPPSVAGARVIEELLRIEESLGLGIRERFVPERGSPAAEER